MRLYQNTSCDVSWPGFSLFKSFYLLQTNYISHIKINCSINTALNLYLSNSISIFFLYLLENIIEIQNVTKSWFDKLSIIFGCFIYRFDISFDIFIEIAIITFTLLHVLTWVNRKRSNYIQNTYKYIPYNCITIVIVVFHIYVFTTLHNVAQYYLWYLFCNGSFLLFLCVKPSLMIYILITNRNCVFLVN